MSHIFSHILFQNHNRHQTSCEPGIIVYAMNGCLYERINNGTPKLIAGILIPNDGSSNAGGDYRGNHVMLNTGTTDIEFSSPMGVNGGDYTVTVYVRDSDGAEPSYDLSNFKRTGFKVTVYSDNIYFRWAALLDR